ncbi:MAG: hypothetical protein JSR32_10750 [Proteobacteria bacterium]|nr:hypothetical protein [Pseudomonadota bacterium]
MKVTELANQLGVSRQILYRHIKRGCPTDSLESAQEWRAKNLDITQTQQWRIDGNSGIKCQPSKPVHVNLEADRAYSDAEKKIIENTLARILPNLYFERVDWLAVALKEAGVPVTGNQVIEIQDTLLSMYMEEIIYGYLQSNSHFELPPLFKMRLDSEEHKAAIASIDRLLS